MDPKKPEEDEPRRPSPAAERADALTGGKSDATKAAPAKDSPVKDASKSKPEPGQASQRLQEKRKAETAGKPVLTEKQRIEARQKRRSQRRRRPAATGNAISRGVRATGHEVKRTLIFLGRSILSGLDSLKPVGEAIVSALSRLVAWVGGALVRLATLVATLLAATGRLLLELDRVVTARRAFTLVALVAAGLLIASQFMDFRAIEIGQPGYFDVRDVATAPRTEVKSPIDSHSLILVIAGIAALAAAALSAVSPRRVLGLALVFTGGLTLAVALAIDLPVGLDIENAELSYAGVKAVLLGGFWLELAAGGVLLISGLALAVPPPGKRAVAETRRRPARATVAGSSA